MFYHGLGVYKLTEEERSMSASDLRKKISEAIRDRKRILLRGTSVRSITFERWTRRIDAYTKRLAELTRFHEDCS